MNKVKLINLLLFLTFTMILTGCDITHQTETSKSDVTTNNTTTTSIELSEIKPVILDEFEVGVYYKISPKNHAIPSTITFYDEVDREIESHEFSVELIKVPEYTHKISLLNMSFEKVEFETQVYPTDKEIKDEEFGGEKPVYILKEQLVLGKYYIRYRDYLEEVWTIDLYKNNEHVGTYEFIDWFHGDYTLWTNSEFDYVRLYNCSLVFYEPLS